MNNGLTTEHVDGFVVDDLAITNQPVVTMTAVGIQCDIADDPEVIADLLFDGRDRAANQIVRVGGLASVVGAGQALTGEHRDVGVVGMGPAGLAAARAGPLVAAGYRARRADDHGGFGVGVG